MLKKEMQKVIDQQERKIEDLEQNLEVTYDGQKDLRTSLEMAEDAVVRHKEQRIYLEGQNEVFKRILKTHPEQVPTREEYKREPYNQEILSSQDLPF